MSVTSRQRTDRDLSERLRWICATTALAFASLLVACAVDRDSAYVDDLPTSESTEPLWISNGITRWLGFVPVCFLPGFTQAQQDTIRRDVTDTWGRAAALQFSGWGACATPVPGGSVAVEINGGLGANVLGLTSTLGYPGAGNHTTVSYATGSPSQKTIIHEFGHVLGFLHEHLDDRTCKQRTDGGDELGTQADAPTSVMSQTECNSSDTPSPWDIVGVQNAYGRRGAGSIVGMNAQCLHLWLPFTGAGENLQVDPCSGLPQQRWHAAPDRTISAPAYTPSILDIKNASTNNGTPVQVFTQNVPLTLNQQWRFDGMEIRGIGNLCVGIAGPIFSGEVLFTGACTGDALQAWNVEFASDSDVIVRSAANPAYCIGVLPNSVPGNTLHLVACTGSDPNQIFGITALGELTSQGLCWDSANGVVSPQLMQLFTCKAAGVGKSNQQYFLRGKITSSLALRCLTTQTTDFRPHDPVEMYGCPNNSDFIWDYYFNP